MRLTADLIARRPQFINPLKDRELDLRGQHIPAIENLSATQDQFDAIDLSNNDLKKLESATVLKRLKMLLLSNNMLNRLADNLGACFPSLELLVLSNNGFAKLSDLDNLASLASLRSLSLIDNDVAKVPEYRLYVLHLLPHLRSLDFQAVKQKEVDAATLRFGKPSVTPGKRARAGAAHEATAAGSKRERPQGAEDGARGEASDEEAAGSAPPPKVVKVGKPAESSILSPELVAAAREALANATSLEEVQELERALKSRNVEALQALLNPQRAPAADVQMTS